jgi:hypothetical protein
MAWPEDIAAVAGRIVSPLDLLGIALRFAALPTAAAETATNVPDTAAAPSNADTDAPPALSREELDDDDVEEEDEEET